MRDELRNIITSNATGLDQPDTDPPTWFRYSTPFLFVVLPADRFPLLNPEQIAAIWTHFRVAFDLEDLICDPGFLVKQITHSQFIVLVFAEDSGHRVTQQELLSAWQHLISSYPIHYSPVRVAESLKSHPQLLPCFTQSQRHGTGNSPSPVSTDAQNIMRQLEARRNRGTSKDSH